MSEQKQQGFIEHLEELRRRLFIALGAILAGTIAAYAFSEKLLHFLIGPIRPEMGRIYFFSPSEAFVIRLKVAFLAGVFLTSPILISQIWGFVAPGLYQKEKRMAVPVVLATSLLFIGGAFFSFFLVVPIALQFLISFQTHLLQPMISIENYLSFLTSMALAFGVAFNLPVVIIILTGLGVVKVSSLVRYRRHAVVLVFVVAAILTPPDVISQILLAIPLLLLYEVGILGAKLTTRGRPKCG